MGSLGSKEQYKAKEEGTFFNDGREEQLLEFVRQKCVQDPSTRTPEGVLQLIDQYGSQQKYLMNIGSKKGPIIVKLITERKPQTMVEFGSYVGYSTILFADAVKQNGGKEYISFERDTKFAGVAAALVELAGLNDIVRFVIGSSSKNLFVQHGLGHLESIDMIFLDHYKPAYVRDLKICESLGLISKGTILAADNVISPGNPSYLEYVRSTVQEKKRKLDNQSEDAHQKFPERTVNQYQDVEEDDAQAPGDPNIEYSSYLVHSEEPTGEPDGIEVTTRIS